ncbi:MAG TPA: hypothetical protein VF875_11975 [Anaeromyxobacter sp.]
MQTRALAILSVPLLALSGAAAAAADPIPPGGVPDVVAARTLSLAASIGVASGNEGIYVNPGAIAARKRYSVEGMILFDRRGAENVDRFYGGSVVDSQTSSITAGLSYLHDQGALYTGNVLHLALAGNLAEAFHVGVTGKLFSLEGPTSYRAGNVDAGAYWQVSELVSMGFVGYNLLSSGNSVVSPMAAGAGFAVGSDRYIQVTGDWRADFDRNGGKTTNRWAGGAEALLGDVVVVRGGFMRDETLGTNWWSAGVGVVTQSAALDVGYRQSTTDASARQVAATLKVFVNQ